MKTAQGQFIIEVKLAKFPLSSFSQLEIYLSDFRGFEISDTFVGLTGGWCLLFVWLMLVEMQSALPDVFWQMKSSKQKYQISRTIHVCLDRGKAIFLHRWSVALQDLLFIGSATVIEAIFAADCVYSALAKENLLTVRGRTWSSFPALEKKS